MSALVVDGTSYAKKISSPLKCWQCRKVLLAHFVPTPTTEMVSRCPRCGAISMWPPSVDKNAVGAVD